MTTATAPPVDHRDLAPGAYQGLPDREYDRIDAVRSSLLQHFRRTPLHARHVIEHPEDPTPAMVLGQAVHHAVLLPDTFTEHFARSPAQEKRSKADREAWAQIESEHPDCLILRPSEWDYAFRMRDAVWAHPVAKRLLSGPGKRELTLIWEERGVRCKARLDLLGRHVSEWDEAEWPAIIDLKTTKDASEREFRRSIHTYGYDVQAAHYLAGAEALAPVERKWVFICVENVRPHAVRVLEMEPAALEHGRKRRDRFLALYAECTRTGQWPGYGDQVDFIGLPQWAYREEGVDGE